MKILATAILISSIGPALQTPADTAYGEQETKFADLRSFFHGDPPPVPKAPPPRQLATVTTDAGVQADPQVESFLRAMADAIKARDGKPLLARLADTYTIDDLPADRRASEFFVQAMERIAGPTAIIIKSIERQGNVRTAHVELHYGPDQAKAKIFRFDAGGRLLWSDLFRLQAQRAAG